MCKTLIPMSTDNNIHVFLMKLPRTSNPTVRSDRNSSDFFVSDSDRKLLDVGMVQYPEIPAFSDIQQLPVGIRYEEIRRIPIESDGVRLT